MFIRQRQRYRRAHRRRGAAAVELAILLPFLMFVFAVGADWCRIFYTAHTLDDCARSGALAGSGIAYQERGLSESQRQSRARTDAVRDGENLSPPLETSDVTVTTAGNYISVTVSHNFQTVASYPGVGRNWQLSRTVRMPVTP